MMLFRSEEEIDRWCATTGGPRGETIPLGTVWDLSKVWYGNRMSPDFRGRTVDEVMAVFHQFGLMSDFWHVGQEPLVS